MYVARKVVRLSAYTSDLADDQRAVSRLSVEFSKVAVARKE